MSSSPRWSIMWGVHRCLCLTRGGRLSPTPWLPSRTPCRTARTCGWTCSQCASGPETARISCSRALCATPTRSCCALCTWRPLPPCLAPTPAPSWPCPRKRSRCAPSSACGVWWSCMRRSASASPSSCSSGARTRRATSSPTRTCARTSSTALTCAPPPPAWRRTGLASCRRWRKRTEGRTCSTRRRAAPLWAPTSALRTTLGCWRPCAASPGGCARSARGGRGRRKAPARRAWGSCCAAPPPRAPPLPWPTCWRWGRRWTRSPPGRRRR
mmetsp:Transcript_7997/g.16363  ORF Transcript_7997/g.16363 Transcript_7997/m.16363 type:complete len:270 (-) Transcript_7997:616-1425(-)